MLKSHYLFCWTGTRNRPKHYTDTNNSSYSCVIQLIYNMMWYDDVACSGGYAYMLGLSMNSIVWRRALYSSVSHFIQPSFLPSSSTSVSYLLLHPLLLLIFQFLIFFLFSLTSFIPFPYVFLYQLVFFILFYSSFHFNCSFSFLMLCFP